MKRLHFIKRFNLTALFLIILFPVSELASAYPIDGFWLTGIRRLVRLQMILNGEIKDTKPVEGARKTLNEIHLQLMNAKGDSLATLPNTDAALEKKLKTLFPNLDESYSVTLLDITPGKPFRYASRQETRGFQPGSVGKLAVLSRTFYGVEKYLSRFV